MDLYLIFLIAFGAQALMGILLFEWAYMPLKKHRDGNESRDKQFPAFRRVDAQKWSRLRFYPGAVFLLTFRAVFCIVSLFLITLFCQILIGCHDFNKGPLKNGCRRRSILFLLRMNAYIWVFISGAFTENKKVDYDYTKYLGPDYKSKFRAIERVPTMVGNHVSWLDSMVTTKYYQLAFTLKAEMKNFPCFGTLAKVVDTIFISRGGTDEERAKLVQQICDRQELIETTGEYQTLLVFPEGTTTNGTAVMQFKKGALVSERTLKPVVLKYDTHNAFSQAFDIIPLIQLLVLNFSYCGSNSCTVIDLPEFQPNEYLFETHKDKGAERWQIIAWAVREIIADAGQFDLCEMTIKQKVRYQEFMKSNPKYPTPHLEEELNAGVTPKNDEEKFGGTEAKNKICAA